MFLVYCLLLLLWLTGPPLMILERSPNWPTSYADNLSLHVSSKGITRSGGVCPYNKSIFRFASHRTRNLARKTEKSGTVGAYDKAGGVDTICIPLKDVDPTAEKLYPSDLSVYCSSWTYDRIVIVITFSNIKRLIHVPSETLLMDPTVRT